MSMLCKDPQAVIDQEVDWSAYLAGQMVVASGWSVAPDEAGGITIEAEAREPSRTSARLAGGIVGRVYRVTNQVTLSDGQVDERSLTVRVEER
ncbi:phage fiber-tail adaptor protein [Sphingobium ummariense]|uniref:Uncharacterized protein n=1 Tax=Sphingobium ummariense RL-3 TaxID=1346791 RepID=T0J5Q1_9SPHN|nr:hypothetical protein [Sphingobium ummariense]EQB33296.1 hypothetical protein M529_04930 [Sphingobium ummariense RL-3]